MDAIYVDKTHSGVTSERVSFTQQMSPHPEELPRASTEQALFACWLYTAVGIRVYQAHQWQIVDSNPQRVSRHSLDKLQQL